MNKKSIIAAAALLLLAGALLLGLPWMTDRMADARMGQIVTVTPTPPPGDYGLEQ